MLIHQYYAGDEDLIERQKRPLHHLLSIVSDTFLVSGCFVWKNEIFRNGVFLVK